MTLYILVNPQSGFATARTIIKAIHEQVSRHTFGDSLDRKERPGSYLG